MPFRSRHPHALPAGVAAVLLVTALAACAPAEPSTQPAAASPTDEDFATARAACASVAAGAERDRCIEIQLRRARGTRNTY